MRRRITSFFGSYIYMFREAVDLGVDDALRRGGPEKPSTSASSHKY